MHLSLAGDFPPHPGPLPLKCRGEGEPQTESDWRKGWGWNKLSPLMPCIHHPDAVDDLIVCWRCRRTFCRNCVVELQSYYFCADCKPLQVRDMLAGTDMLSPDYAPLGKRLGGWLIDGMVKSAVGFAIGFTGQLIAMAAVQSKAPEIGMAVNIAFFLVGQACEVAYEALMLSRNNGQTLGKMAVGIRVTTVDGNPIAAAQAWWRAMFKVILNFASCTCGCVAWLLDGAFVFGPERTALHDLAAQTRVVNVD